LIIINKKTSNKLQALVIRRLLLTPLLPYLLLVFFISRLF